MLDWNTFEAECLDLRRRSQALSPQDCWIWKTLSDLAIKESSYMQCTNKVRLSTKLLNQNVDYIQEEKIDEVEDPASVPPEQFSKVNLIITEYHIVYSTTYRVPVLYFNAHRPDGALLTLDEIWDELRSPYMTDENKWSFLTQGEHPLLGVPFFFIHPCQTQLLMQQVKTMDSENKKQRYLLPWLSVFAPIAGLKLPTELFIDK